jgi:hypothetical protein
MQSVETDLQTKVHHSFVVDDLVICFKWCVICLVSDLFWKRMTIH